MSTRSRVRPERSGEAGSRTEPNSQSGQLTDRQWGLIKDLFPAKRPSKKGGRPRCDSRACFEGILWVLITGARWKDLPKCFPSKSTCHLRFKEWTESGLFEKAWRRLLRHMDELGEIDWSECMGDGTFSSAKKGVIALGQPVAGRGPRSCSLWTGTEFHSVWTSKRPTATKLL